MKKFYTLAYALLISFILTGCSVLGHSGVEIAPYTVLEKEGDFELRHYDRLVLVSTPMSDIDEANSPFSKLFDYISGENDQQQSIAMTAPVFMDQGQQQSETMAFVMPASFDMVNTPAPTNPAVTREEITDYTVATITFNGLLRQDNIQKHKALLQDWVKQKQYTPLGLIKAAGYNPPFTIPALRRNEVLIQVEKP